MSTQEVNLAEALSLIVTRLEKLEQTGEGKPDDELVGIDEVASMLNVSRVTVDRMKRCDELPMPIMLRGVQRWRRGEVRAWIRAGCVRTDVWEKVKKNYL